MCVRNQGGNRYVFVLVDDFSRFTWTFFLKPKEKTFDAFTIFAKMVQKKLKCELISLRSDHGTKFENSNFLKFCIEKGVVHNFSAPRTQQKKWYG